MKQCCIGYLLLAIHRFIISIGSTAISYGTGSRNTPVSSGLIPNKPVQYQTHPYKLSNIRHNPMVDVRHQTTRDISTQPSLKRVILARPICQFCFSIPSGPSILMARRSAFGLADIDPALAGGKGFQIFFLSNMSHPDQPSSWG